MDLACQCDDYRASHFFWRGRRQLSRTVAGRSNLAIGAQESRSARLCDARNRRAAMRAGVPRAIIDAKTVLEQSGAAIGLGIILQARTARFDGFAQHIPNVSDQTAQFGGV